MTDQQLGMIWARSSGRDLNRRTPPGDHSLDIGLEPYLQPVQFFLGKTKYSQIHYDSLTRNHQREGQHSKGCAECGASNEIEMYHVRKLLDLEAEKKPIEK